MKQFDRALLVCIFTIAGLTGLALVGRGFMSADVNAKIACLMFGACFNGGALAGLALLAYNSDSSS
jgi:hypothetical protein